MLTPLRATVPPGRRIRPRRLGGGEGGFALLVVIWLTGLLSLLALAGLAASRQRSTEASVLAARAQAEATADGAIALAAMGMLAALARGEEVPRQAGAGTPGECAARDVLALAVATLDEGGKVDLNTAEPDLIAAAARSAGTGAALAETIALAVEDARAAAAADPLASASGSGAFRSIFELDRVVRLDREPFLRLLAMLTVHSGAAGVDPQVAGPQVLAALDEAGSSTYESPSRGRHFTLSASAAHPGGPAFRREALVQVRAGPPASYRVIEWREGAPLAGPGDQARCSRTRER